jgi:hypothetical protein
MNGGGGGGCGGVGGGAPMLNGEDEHSQLRACCTEEDDDDNLPHLITCNMPMMQMNQMTCYEVEMTYSSCVQSTIQSSDML